MAPRVRIKFCGLRRAGDVREAVRLGADFLGFVFASDSPRRLEIADAAACLAGVDTGTARRVGVFRDQPAEWVNEAARRCGLHLAQLHGRESAAYLRALAVPAILVLRAPSAATDAEPDLRAVGHADVFAALIDAQDAAGRSGGLGVRADQATLGRVMAALPVGMRVFLAGGLTPDNVAEAVVQAPYAVDVSSGVESAPGVKDPVRMRAFVEAVRRASRSGK